MNLQCNVSAKNSFTINSSLKYKNTIEDDKDELKSLMEANRCKTVRAVAGAVGVNNVRTSVRVRKVEKYDWRASRVDWRALKWYKMCTSTAQKYELFPNDNENEN